MRIASARPTPRSLAVLVGLAAAATISGALASQYVYGLVPCKLCLWQRWPYYIGVPLAALTALLPASRPAWGRFALVLLALVFLASAALGAYHAGVEWGWWPGPADCGGGTGTAPASVGGLLGSLDNIKVVSCEDAAWRWLGLSLAGWNALVSLGLAIVSGAAAVGGTAAPVSECGAAS